MAYGNINVNNTATLIVDSNPQRLSLLIQNNSSYIVYLGQDNNVTFSNGIPLSGNGVYSEDSGGTKAYCGPIYGIADTVSYADVRFWERTR